MTSPREPSGESLDDIFGEVLPRISADERDAGTPEDASDRDEWLRDNRPPHHF